jgi:uncharacterized SAM-binding protein YcdF (DUF218 family)
MSFYLSKLLWLIVHPGNLLLFTMIIGWLALRRGWLRLGPALIKGAVAFFLMLAFLPVGATMLTILENRFPVNISPPERVDGIIVLGGFASPVLSEAWGYPVVGGGGRLIAFLALAKKYPEAKLLFTGGSGDILRQDVSEARVVKRLLSDLGFPIERVIFEDQSRNTVENARLSKPLAKPKEGENWLLITSAFHMPRAVGCFHAADWQVLAYPVDHITEGRLSILPSPDFLGNFERFVFAWHEWLGLIAYRLMGRTDALFPAP